MRSFLLSAAAIAAFAVAAPAFAQSTPQDSALAPSVNDTATPPRTNPNPAGTPAMGAGMGGDVAATPALLDTALQQKHLRVDGLMTIAPLSADPAVAQRTFARLRLLRDELAARSGLTLRELSMGMSGDLALAIAEGSTLVRVGTALFGTREAP